RRPATDGHAERQAPMNPRSRIPRPWRRLARTVRWARVGLILAAALVGAPAALASCPNGIEQRKDIHTMTQSQVTEFVTALRKMQTPSAPGTPSVFDKFVAIHIGEASLIHNYADFLPWHREFLLEFEQALQKIDPQVTIPYWDVALDASNPASSIVFANSEF